MKITTNIPYFSGFYGNDYTADVAYSEYEHLNDINSELSDELDELGLIRDFCDKLDDDIDYQKTHENLAKRAFELFERKVNNCALKLCESMEFSRLWSPREYNFDTDRIYVTFEFTEEQWLQLANEVLTENR